MRFGIIGAMPEEIHTLSDHLEEKREWTEAGATFLSGKYGPHEVVVVQSGIGKVLAAVTATLLISHYHVEYLINTGSAGGIGKGLKIGDLVISEKLAYYDADVTAFGYEYGQLPGMPLYYEADQNGVALAISIAKESGLAVKTGLIVSGDSFISSQTQISAVTQKFPETLAAEMEGAAIAQVAYQYHIPFIVIRSMSDTGDEEASVNFDEFIIEAGRTSARFVLDFLERMSV